MNKKMNKKPLNHKNYGSIPHLSNSKLGIGDHYINEGMERILTVKKRDRHDEIFVFEKYDGSNVGIAKINGKIIALTRSGYEAKTSDYMEHLIFHSWVNLYSDIFNQLLNEKERIVGELMIKTVSLKYKITSNPVIFFDMFSEKNKRLSMHEFKNRLSNFPFRVARMLHCGDAIPVEKLINILNFGTRGFDVIDGTPEGMIYRVERKGQTDFLAKWVRSNFEAGKYLDSDVWNEKYYKNFGC